MTATDPEIEAFDVNPSFVSVHVIILFFNISDNIWGHHVMQS